jgi:hypothetical protein
MKKLLSLVLALMLSLTVIPALAEAVQSVYALNVDTLTLTQGPVWSFLYFDEAKNEMVELNATPDWGDNWQFSKQPSVDNVYHSICEWDGVVYAMPGTWIGKHIDIVVSFTAPKAGTVYIAPTSFVVKDDGNPHESYQVKIVKHAAEDVQLFPAEGEWAQTPVATAGIEVAVAEGDKIYFEVRSGDDGGAAVSIQPSIAYKPAE